MYVRTVYERTQCLSLCLRAPKRKQVALSARRLLCFIVPSTLQTHRDRAYACIVKYLSMTQERIRKMASIHSRGWSSSTTTVVLLVLVLVQELINRPTSSTASTSTQAVIMRILLSMWALVSKPTCLHDKKTTGFQGKPWLYR